ncbi:retrotransposon protein, putative, ty1-copia subclass [Tanacetum coccineum]
MFNVSYLYWLEKNVGLNSIGISDDCGPGGMLQISLEYVEREFNHAKCDGELAGVWGDDECGAWGASSWVVDEVGIGSKRNVVMWTARIINNCKEERFREVFEVFNEMGKEGVRKNSFTLSSVLSACSKISDDGNCGEQVHANAIKLGLASKSYVLCGLVNMYGKFGLMNDAKRVFDMNESRRNRACWNAMLTSLVQNGCLVEAIKFLYQMRAAGVQPQELWLNKLRNNGGFYVCDEDGEVLFVSGGLNANRNLDGFVQNYNMHSLGKTVNDLHAMLKLHEQTLTLPKKNVPALHAIRPAERQDMEVGNHVLRPELLKEGKRTQASGVCGLVIVLNNCHYAPSITRGVISVSRLYEDGFINRFVNNTIQVSRNNMVYFSAIPRDGIFEIDLSNSYTNENSIYTVSNKRAKLDLDSALLWHCRLGHISKKRIEKLQHDGLLNSTDLRAFEKCVPCMSGKMARKPYTHQVERAKDLLGLIHTDVCGPFKITSRQGASYFVTFTDDFSRYGYVYLLKHKHEVFETFKVFQKEVENQLGKTIKSLRSDRGGEYMSQEFLDHLKDHGIIAHRTPPYTPQHNGVSERRNRTLLDMVRSMMSQTTLPKSFWDYALETAARILNMVPTKKVEKTPYEVWHGQAPKLSYLKVWGCEALVKRDTLTKPDKLEPRSIKCIFIGYPKETMGYSFYYPPENKVLVARNAEFLENSLINQEASGSLEDLEIIQEEDTHPSIDTSLNHEEDDLEIDEPQSDIIPIRRSTRTRRPTDRMCLYIDAEEHELGDLGEPANYKAALLDHESDKWLNAMNWLFKKKTDMDGAVHTYKACLMAKGYTQTPGIDYEETFSFVAVIRAIRILIAIALFYDYEIWQIDVKTAFLNGYISEEVYMEQPEGFVNPKYPNRVCKLKRSIYGLKQASRQWNK